jgi:hypothetical protein
VLHRSVLEYYIRFQCTKLHCSILRCIENKCQLCWIRTYLKHTTYVRHYSVSVFHRTHDCCVCCILVRIETTVTKYFSVVECSRVYCRRREGRVRERENTYCYYYCCVCCYFVCVLSHLRVEIIILNEQSVAEHMKPIRRLKR